MFVSSGGIMLYKKRLGGLDAAAQECATEAPLFVLAGAEDVCVECPPSEPMGQAEVFS